MLKRPHYITLGAVFLLVLVLFKLPSQTVTRLKMALSGFFLPLFGLAVSSQQVLEKVGNTVIPRKDLERQLEQYRRENAEARIRRQQDEEMGRENEKLRLALGWQKQSPWKLKLARVIARDPSNFWRTLQIDLGSNDGLKPNLPVMTVDGLVGRLTAVGNTRSTVVLLGDPNLRIAAVVKESGETGVAFSSTSRPIENEMIDLGYLSGHSSIQAGQTVLSSGDGGVFPKGILIGQIVDWRSIDFGLATEARVKLAAKMNSLEEVWVLLP